MTKTPRGISGALAGSSGRSPRAAQPAFAVGFGGQPSSLRVTFKNTGGVDPERYPVRVWARFAAASDSGSSDARSGVHELSTVESSCAGLAVSWRLQPPRS